MDAWGSLLRGALAARVHWGGIAVWFLVWALSLALLERRGPELAACWRTRAAHPGWRIAARLRTRIGVVFVVGCLAVAFQRGLPPYAPERRNGWLVPALVLMALGIALRVAALGVIHKRKELATQGIYSLCRHPLYLGTIVMALGVCLLFRQPWNMPAAWVYFFLLYPLTMAKEELENEVRFGADFDVYRARTPLILPLGAWRPVHEFDWSRSWLKGGLVALASMAGALIVAKVMTALLDTAQVS